MTIVSKFRVYVDNDNSLILLNLTTDEAEKLDLDNEFIEFESNYRVGAKVIAWDGNSCSKQFN
jgi:stringent starvation protein B